MANPTITDGAIITVTSGGIVSIQRIGVGRRTKQLKVACASGGQSCIFWFGGGDVAALPVGWQWDITTNADQKGYVLTGEEVFIPSGTKTFLAKSLGTSILRFTEV